MKKLAFFLATMLLPASAMAMDTRDAYNVYIQGANVGAWIIDLDESVAGFCRYNVEWINNSIFENTGNCYIDEAKTHGHRGCLFNSQQNFTTLVTLSPNCVCTGFDKFQAPAVVLDLLLGEQYNGLLTGVVRMDSVAAGVYGIELR